MIALGSDHGGFALKQHIKTYLDSKGIAWKDFGCDSTESCDYPDFGAAAAKLIQEKKYGNMVSLQGGSIVPVPLSEVAGKLKTVPTDCEEIRAAKEIGIRFGD